MLLLLLSPLFPLPDSVSFSSMEREDHNDDECEFDDDEEEEEEDEECGRGRRSVMLNSILSVSDIFRGT